MSAGRASQGRCKTTDGANLFRSDDRSCDGCHLFGSKPGLLLRASSGEVKAFSAVCTHLDCIVQYQPESKQIWCACHNGQYNLNGQNIGGPPPRPLEEYTVNTRGDEIIVSKG